MAMSISGTTAAYRSMVGDSSSTISAGQTASRDAAASQRSDGEDTVSLSQAATDYLDRGSSPETELLNATRDLWVARGIPADKLVVTMGKDGHPHVGIKVDPSEVYSVANGRLKPVELTQDLVDDFQAFKDKAIALRGTSEDPFADPASTGAMPEVWYMFHTRAEHLDRFDVFKDDRTGAVSDWSRAVRSAWVAERFGGETAVTPPADAPPGAGAPTSGSPAADATGGTAGATTADPVTRPARAAAVALAYERARTAYIRDENSRPRVWAAQMWTDAATGEMFSSRDADLR